MKIIKKIATIMLSVMMVLGMCSVVGAAETSGTSATVKGKIKISDAVPGQTYTIYKILDLESYDATDSDNAHYAYKVATEWSGFFKPGAKGANYVTIDNAGYVTWKSGADVATFAKEASAYAKDTPVASKGSKSCAQNASMVEFESLELGYYLVDSTVGALCSINTTNNEVTIKEKNGVPSVEKKVQEDSDNHWYKGNTADIGQTVNFQTTITAQAGAQNYVLHDKMDAGLTFGSITGIKKNDEQTDIDNRFYNVKKSTDTPLNITDECTFEIIFTQEFCDTLKANDKITVTYTATLNESAVIAGEGNKNKTWLKYGDSSETTHDETTTKTFEIPVFKYTNKNGTEKPLEGAEFTLTRDGETVPIKLVKVAVAGASDNVYRVAMKSETGETVISDGKVTTPSTGKFTIKGLDAGTYNLTETKQPDGYNKLTTPVTIIISDTGIITVNGTNVNLVKVENKSGSILPSTGGMGTTLFYIFGAILVVGSGVVLITKKRMK